MAFRTEEDRQTVRDMIIAGQGMVEIIALDVCSHSDVYQMRAKLKEEGVTVKKPTKPAEDATPSSVVKTKKKNQTVKLGCPAWLEGLIQEQGRLQEHLRRIDALVAMYDNLIPLPKNLQH